LLQVVIEPGLVSTLSVPGGIQEEVGNLRHRGNDCDYGSPGRFSADQVAGRFDSLGGSDAGTAKFHHQQIVYSQIGPFLLRCDLLETCSPAPAQSAAHNVTANAQDGIKLVFILEIRDKLLPTWKCEHGLF
jgi:hypothetical protein